MPCQIQKRCTYGLVGVIYAALSFWLIIALNQTLNETQLQMKQLSRSFLADIIRTETETRTFERQIRKTLAFPTALNLKMSTNRQQQLQSRTAVLKSSLARVNVPVSKLDAFTKELSNYDTIVHELGKALNSLAPGSPEFKAKADILLQSLAFSVAFLFTEGSSLLSQQANQHVKVLSTLSTSLSVLVGIVLALFAGLLLALRMVYEQKSVLQKLSTEDGLTSLKNRRSFDEFLSIELAHAKRTHGQLSFLMLDVDHFKMFNDTYGHAEGDIALVRVSEVLQAAMKRQGDLAFRLGGEEFGCLIRTKDKADAVDIAERICAEVQNLNIAHSKNENIGVLTVSIGMAQLPNVEITTEDAFYRTADEALYLAKTGGRNRLIVA